MEQKEYITKVVEILQKARAEYQLAIDFVATPNDFKVYLMHLQVYYGLCFWLIKNCNEVTASKILDVLQENQPFPTYDGFYWYPAPAQCDNTYDIIQDALQPRLDHINCTIARLEKN